MVYPEVRYEPKCSRSAKLSIFQNALQSVIITMQLTGCNSVHYALSGFTDQDVLDLQLFLHEHGMKSTYYPHDKSIEISYEVPPLKNVEMTVTYLDTQSDSTVIDNEELPPDTACDRT